MSSIKTSISLTEILARYNMAFGYNATKIAARFLNLPSYETPNGEFANLTLKNSTTGDEYRFGLDMLDKGTPALPFISKKPTIRKFLAPPPMVSFSRSKNVVMTTIDRSNAEVIENFGNKPYEVRFQGILIDASEHQYPGDILREVHQMFENNGTYQVSGTIFEDLNICELFFHDGLSFDFVEGYVDTIKWSASAKAVEPAEFLMK